MRVTEGMRISAVVSATGRAGARVVQLSKQASTGSRVQAPSDDPVAFRAAASADAALYRLATRKDVLSRHQGDLDAAEGQLASAGDAMVRAREIALAMANGSMDAEARTAAASEINAIREQMLSIANGKGANGYLFGGTATDTPPFLPSGAFVGNAQSLGAEIGDGVVIPISVSGANAFTSAGGQDVFADLATLSTALSTNDQSGAGNMLGALDAGAAQIRRVRGDAGIASSRLQIASEICDATAVVVARTRASEREADVIETLSSLSQMQAAYGRSLEVTRRLLGVSSGSDG